MDVVLDFLALNKTFGMIPRLYLRLEEYNGEVAGETRFLLYNSESVNPKSLFNNSSSSKLSGSFLQPLTPPYDASPQDPASGDLRLFPVNTV